MKMAFLVICPGSFQYGEGKKRGDGEPCRGGRGCRKGGAVGGRGWTKIRDRERERERERGTRRVNIGKVREELSSSLERDMLPLSELIIILNKS